MRRSLILLFFALAYAHSITLTDSSDWWSLNGKDPGRPNVKASGNGLQLSNFQIAGIVLGQGGSEAISASLGAVTSVERGDASTGRSQLCYGSKDGNLHLVFEFGEDESLFYLFSGGTPWRGEQYCVQPKKDLKGASTVSGLKLGLSRVEVEKILGRPDAATSSEILYSRQFQQKSTLQAFETFRREYPQNLSDEEAHKEFDFYPVEQYVVARFANSKLVYLAVSVSGEGD